MTTQAEISVEKCLQHWEKMRDQGGGTPTVEVTIAHLRRLQKVEAIGDDAPAEYKKLRNNVNIAVQRLLKLARIGHPPENEVNDAQYSLTYHSNNLAVYLDKNIDLFLAKINRLEAELVPDSLIAEFDRRKLAIVGEDILRGVRYIAVTVSAEEE